ncbi:hypothetical protein MSj_01661 [Microcystis aeruginosa Sj]|uniref:Uncharacterized protein n=1 Tax=Microcystis aeruginosa Sj TaxID=1979544 RepID=A0A2Z6UJU2_MICAE|nr:hypothetical protein MSj_01661 [Microcystis aeruginosa Sj]
MLCNERELQGVKPLYRKTLLQFLPTVFGLERTNQLNLLPDKDLVDLCPPIEPYQVTKNLNWEVGGWGEGSARVGRINKS